MTDKTNKTLNQGIRIPPTSKLKIIREIGPGIIIAGAVVGSGELIATTAVGAEAGFYLLWLLILGCVIKVFIQIELGQYAILNQKTTLEAYI
jgi:Mn2+/Fe2+ NRAMP family transporter